ncbi:MAG: glycosyltransferase, partial [Anaerolineae bacterium]|nr:glycosyltransferase [Anaerolineae bacterium]
MTYKPTVSIILGAYNRLEFLKVVIQNTRQEIKNIPHEIIVVDGGSTDGSLEWLITQKDIVTIVQHNRGDWDGKTIMRQSWGYFMNLAFKSAKAPHILMISDDTVFHKGAIENALAFIETQKQLGKRIGAVPFFFHDVNLEPENQYKVGVLLGNRFLSHGIYMRDAFAEVGFADEDNFMFYGADIDICFKLIHAGYEIIPCPTAFMLHCPYHPLRHTIENRDAIWLEGTTALI